MQVQQVTENEMVLRKSRRMKTAAVSAKLTLKRRGKHDRQTNSMQLIPSLKAISCLASYEVHQRYNNRPLFDRITQSNESILHFYILFVANLDPGGRAV